MLFVIHKIKTLTPYTMTVNMRLIHRNEFFKSLQNLFQKLKTVFGVVKTKQTSPFSFHYYSVDMRWAIFHCLDTPQASAAVWAAYFCHIAISAGYWYRSIL